MRDLEWLKTQSKEGTTLQWGLNFTVIKDMPLNYYTFHVISDLLNNHPLVKSCIELGQFTGSMSIYLGLEGVARKLECHSFEITKQTSVETDRILERLGVVTHYMDVFKYHDEVKTIIAKQPCLLIIDGGDKRREFLEFVPHVPQHSVILVHDFGREFDWKDAIVHSDKLVPINPQYWNYLNCQTACFLVK